MPYLWGKKEATLFFFNERTYILKIAQIKIPSYFQKTSRHNNRKLHPERLNAWPYEQERNGDGECEKRYCRQYL